MVTLHTAPNAYGSGSCSKSDKPLGLSDHEEDLIVIFLGTLTDGFTTPYSDADKYTGDCLPPAALSPPPPLPSILARNATGIASVLHSV